MSGRDYQEWAGALISSTYHDEYVKERDELANLAYSGKFDKVIALIEAKKNPNSWRLRRPEEIDSKPPTGWTALHQAAVLQTANVDVIEKLVSLGCFRNLRTLDTRETAYDLAKKANRDRNILSALKPVYYKQLDATTISNLQKGLNSVVHSRVNDLVKEHRLRIPPVEVLLELESLHFWFPIPGFYGGFHIKLLDNNTIETESFCRVAGGSGETHVIQPDGTWKRTQSGLY